MVNSTEELASLQGVLETSLTESRVTLNTALQNCADLGEQDCQDLKDNVVPNLQTDADFTSINTSAAELASAAINYQIENGLLETVDQAIEAFENIEENIRNTTDETIREIEYELEGMLVLVEKKWDEVQEEIRQVDVDGIKEEVDEWGKKINGYMEDYYTWFYIGIVIIITAVTAFNLLGIMFGLFCPRPEKESSCMSCSTATGGCFLMISVFLIFLLGWVLMIITVVYYVAGGGTEFLLCRHLVVYDESMQEIERVTFNTLEKFNYSISIREVIDDCKNDTALYTSLRLDENGFNVSDLLDLSDTKFYEIVNELKNITVDLGTVTIVTDELNMTMLAIDQALDTINFDSYRDETEKDLVMTDVQSLADELIQIAQQLNDSGQGVAGAELTVEAEKLNEIIANSITPMETENQTLTTALTAAEATVQSVDASQLVNDLKTSEDGINNEAPEITSEVIGQTTDVMVHNIEKFIDQTENTIINDLAGCYPIYDTLKTITYSTCIYFLYPFNSLWFCLGWYLFCCVFTLIFGVKLAGYLRQIPEPKPPQQQTQRTQDIEMHASDNAAYLAPDYDDAPPSAYVHPGPDKKTKRLSQQLEPPPKYEELMRSQILVAQELDKQRKAEKKKQQKEAKKAKKAEENARKEAAKKEQTTKV